MTAIKITLFFILSFVAVSSYGSQPAGENDTNSTIENQAPSSSENEEASGDPAEMHYRRALELRTEARFNLLDDEVLSNILKELDSAIRLNPNKAVYFKERGDVYSSKSLSESKILFRYEKVYGLKAINDYSKCIELSINEPVIAFYCQSSKPDIMCDIGDKQEALNMYRQLIAKTAKGEDVKLIGLHESRADCYIKNKKYVKAIEDLTKAINLHEKGSSKQVEPINTLWQKWYQNWKEKLHSKRAEAYHSHSQLIQALSDHEEACKICRQMAECHELSCQRAFNVKREIKRGANWEMVSKSEDEEVFYDKTRVTVLSGRNVKVWLRMETTVGLKDQKFPKEDFSVAMSLIHLDCVNQEIGIASSIAYDTDGKVVRSRSGNPNETRQPIVPGSVGDAVSEKICDMAKKKSGLQKNKSQRKGGPERQL